MKSKDSCNIDLIDMFSAEWIKGLCYIISFQFRMHIHISMSSIARNTYMYIDRSTQSSAHTLWLDFVYHIIEFVLIGSNIEECKSMRCPYCWLDVKQVLNYQKDFSGPHSSKLTSCRSESRNIGMVVLDKLPFGFPPF